MHTGDQAKILTGQIKGLEITIGTWETSGLNPSKADWNDLFPRQPCGPGFKMNP
jgi:hypothetical protein